MRTETLGFAPIRRLAAFAIVMVLFFHGASLGAEPSAHDDVASSLAEAQAIRAKDHPRFLKLLDRLHHQEHALSSPQQLQLRLLDGWEALFEGEYAKAEPLLRDVVAHGTLDQQSLANGMLLNMLAIKHRYDEAFALAEQLATVLPRLHDHHVIYVVLSQLSQLMASAEQVDPAAAYARQMAHFSPPGQSMCRPYVYLFGALDAKGDLSPADPIYRKTIDACVAAGEPIYANTVQLDLARRQASMGDYAAALKLLKRIAPGVIAQNYRAHVYVLRSNFAYAYLASGNMAQARKWALAALAMDARKDFDGLSENVYRVLYEVENKAGDYRAALDYYRRYKDVEVRAVSDAQAIALSYQTVRQQLAIHKLKMAELGKQNNVLELQQALDRKAMEATRLYLVLLLIILVLIGFLLIRIKRSQLRFKKLARRDSLTGILNHQHFVSDAQQALRYAEKSSRGACVVLLDLDHFKLINDSFGHAAGDAVLVEVVAVCQRHLRSVDVFGRLGGEEFGLVLPECSLQQGVDIVDRIRAAILATAFDELMPENTISASFGLASTESSGYRLPVLMAHADAALYRAKNSGRNRVAVHDDE